MSQQGSTHWPLDLRSCLICLVRNVCCTLIFCFLHLNQYMRSPSPYSPSPSFPQASHCSHTFSSPSGFPSPSVFTSSSVFWSSELRFCIFFFLTHFRTTRSRMTRAKKPPTEAPTKTATVESLSGGTERGEHRRGKNTLIIKSRGKRSTIRLNT